MRRPSTSGPTRISSRGTSEPVASTVSVKWEGATRTTVTAAASCSSLLRTGVRLGVGCATRVTVTASAQTPTTKPMSSFLITASLPRLGDIGAGRRLRHRPRDRIEQLADHLQHGRHDHLGIEGRIDGALPEHAVADHREGARERWDIHRRRDAAFVFQLLEQPQEAVVDVAVEAAEDFGDARVAGRLQADLHAHQALVRRLVDEILLAHRRQRAEEVGRRCQAREVLCELGALALADAGDQRFLAVEVDVQRPGTYGGFLADVLHGGAMEAGAREAQLRSLQDVLPAGSLRIRLELGHPHSPAAHLLALHKTKRTVVLFGRKVAKSRKGVNSSWTIDHESVMATQDRRRAEG